MGTTKDHMAPSARSPEETASAMSRANLMAGFVCSCDAKDCPRVARVADGIMLAEFSAEQRGIKRAADLLDAEAATQTGYGDLGDYAEDLAHQIRTLFSGNATDRSPTDSSIFGTPGCAGGSEES